MSLLASRPCEDRAVRRQASPLSGTARRAVILICGYVSAGAIYGGSRLVWDAAELGARQSWLRGSPFSDYAIPGVFLLVVVGGGMLLTALAAVLRLPAAVRLAPVMGVILLVWGIVETAVIGYRGGAQLALLATFVVIPAVPLIVIGWHSSHRAERSTG
jgi:hypothetical protein